MWIGFKSDFLIVRMIGQSDQYTIWAYGLNNIYFTTINQQLQ